MRKDPPFDMEYVYSTYLLEHAARQGALVVNDPRAVRDNNEKYSITEFPTLTTDVLVSRDPDRLRAFVARHDEAVLKLLDGMGGVSIFRVRSDDPNLSVILETLNVFGTRTVMAQKYLPAIAAGDKRILLIGGEVVPYALARIPKSGESRGNLAAGGTGRAQPLSARDREIAEQLAPILLSRGLFLVGLDVIGDNLTEINVTSPTCFREIADQTGFDVAGLFIGRLEATDGAGCNPGRADPRMISVLVIAHEPLATALIHCTRHIYGRLPSQVAALDVIPDEDPAIALRSARDLAKRINDGSGLIVLTDVFGATPARVAVQLAEPLRVVVFHGVNLPLLLKLLNYRRNVSLDELTRKLQASVGDSIGLVTPQMAGTGDSSAGSGSDPTGNP